MLLIKFFFTKCKMDGHIIRGSLLRQKTTIEGEIQIQQDMILDTRNRLQVARGRLEEANHIRKEREILGAVVRLEKRLLQFEANLQFKQEQLKGVEDMLARSPADGIR